MQDRVALRHIEQRSVKIEEEKHPLKPRDVLIARRNDRPSASDISFAANHKINPYSDDIDSGRRDQGQFGASSSTRAARLVRNWNRQDTVPRPSSSDKALCLAKRRLADPAL